MMSEPNPVNPASGNFNVIAGNISGNSGHTVVGIGNIINTADTQYDVRGFSASNPYLGLRSFKYEDRDRFAGRDAFIAATVAQITNPAAPLSLLFITGESGSGKSSFVQAGLLPALEAYYARRGLITKCAIFRPGNSPLANLADALAQLALKPLAPDRLADPASFAADLKQTPANQCNILVIDKFEELIILAPESQRDGVFALLENLPAVSDSRTQIICTLRADYLHNLFARERLYQLIKAGVELRAMRVDELRQAIEKPVLLTHPDKRFEPALVERLANDAARNSAYLPLLQVTLEELWNGGWLKLSKYHDLATALRSQAEDVYNHVDYDGLKQFERNEADRATLMSILTDLVKPGDNPHRDVRVQRERGELAKGHPQRDRLIGDLASARLLSISPGPSITASVGRRYDVVTIGLDMGRQGVCDSPLHQSGAYMPSEAVILARG